jgi:hypothetical protein
MNADGSGCARHSGPSTIASRRGRATAIASHSRRIDRATTTSGISTSPRRGSPADEQSRQRLRAGVFADQFDDRFVTERDDRRGIWAIDAASGAEARDAPRDRRAQRAVVERRRPR